MILAGIIPATSLSVAGVAGGKKGKKTMKSYVYKAKFEKYFFIQLLPLSNSKVSLLQQLKDRAKFQDDQQNAYLKK